MLVLQFIDETHYSAYVRSDAYERHKVMIDDVCHFFNDMNIYLDDLSLI